MKLHDFILVAIRVTITSAIGSSIGHALLIFSKQAALVMFGGTPNDFDRRTLIWLLGRLECDDPAAVREMLESM